MNTAHFDYLDGWRGLAIVLLLWGHFFPVPGINLGFIGVNFFFVLSGLLMGRLLFIRKVEIPQFYRRRISRIFPAFFVFVACVVLGHLATGRAVDWKEVFAAATFTTNYFMEMPDQTAMPFGHIWSLSVEEHSYILLSLLAILARRRIVSARWGVLGFTVAMALVGVAYRLLYDGRELGFQLAHSEFAAFGIFLSVLMLLYFHDRTVPTLNVVVFAGIVILGMLVNWWSIPVLVRTFGCFAMLALAINVLGNGPRAVQRLLAFYPLRQLGLWSYSLYLWQQPFYMAVHREGLSPVVGVALGLLCGIASYYLVEQPARLYLNRRWDKAAPVPAPLTAAAPAVK